MFLHLVKKPLFGFTIDLGAMLLFIITWFYVFHFTVYYTQIQKICYTQNKSSALLFLIKV